jgi:hypothetical protein
VKHFDHIEGAIHKASREASRYMTSQLRREAVHSSWSDHAVHAIGVSYNKGSFDVSVHPRHKDEVMDYEYGTSDRRPTAAIRRFANRQQETEKFLVGRIGHHLEGLL